jgi:hypothetical protein
MVVTEVIACACATGSCITGYDVTGSCITGYDVTGRYSTEMTSPEVVNRKLEVKGRSFPAFFPELL